MKYLDEYRDPALGQRLVHALRQAVRPPWTVMEVCGGQTHTLVRSGIDRLVPEALRLVHGPGCPVCVTPLEQIDRALAIAARPGVIFCSFGDMLRVPGSETDLLRIRAAGGDVRVVYSPLDALKIARANPGRDVVFFAVGFETTAPATALAASQARQLGLTNFSMLVSHVLVPPAMELILSAPANRVQAFLAAGHVCTVTGCEAYFDLARRFRVPIVVTGFEPVDLLEGLLMAVRQLEAGRHEVENQYARAVRREGNRPAQEWIARVYEVCDRPWRGLGILPRSGLRLRAEFADIDAERRFNVSTVTAAEPVECHSGEVLRGLIRPDACPAFGTRCTPENPLGAPMVSSEGACAAYWKYGRAAEPVALETSMSQDFSLSCPVPLAADERIQLAHGEGARLTRRLIRDVLVLAFANDYLRTLADGATLPAIDGPLVITTDGSVVSPLFFPGGDIGKLAVHGAVNDLAVCGAEPLYLSVALILEEGLPLETLRRVVASMAEAARACGVQIVTGDTKVVPRGTADQLFITTTGIGRLRPGIPPDVQRVRAGDQVIVSGTIGDHGLAILAAREGLDVGEGLRSDTAPIHDMAAQLLRCATGIRFLRDPTRGGVAAVLHELVEQTGLSVLLRETSLPVSPATRGASEILGLDLLHVANEGKIVAVVAPEDVQSAFACLHAHPLGRAAARIGEVRAGHAPRVLVEAPLGQVRVLDEPSGAPLPRIC